LTFPSVGTWSVVQGTGVFTDENDPNTAVSGLSVGENIFQWIVSNGPCTNALTTDQVSVFVFDENNPVADAGADDAAAGAAGLTATRAPACWLPRIQPTMMPKSIPETANAMASARMRSEYQRPS